MHKHDGLGVRCILYLIICMAVFNLYPKDKSLLTGQKGGNGCLGIVGVFSNTRNGHVFILFVSLFSPHPAKC